MLKDITLGQFFPGSSVVHRLDPRTKLLAVVAYIVAIFMADGPWSYGLCVLSLLAVILISRIQLRLILKSLKPVVVIVLFTAILNMFYVSGEPLITLWKLTITREGLITAVSMSLRIILLVASTSLVTYTTSPIALTDAIESLLGPLKKIHVPVHEFAMMMTIALRFIPTLIDETDKIMSAQKARGADFESGNLLRRAKALVPVLVPLFISAFRRADDLAIAMECRLYHGGAGRTRLHSLRYALIDLWGFLLCAAAVAAIIVLGRVAP